MLDIAGYGQNKTMADRILDSAQLPAQTIGYNAFSYADIAQNAAAVSRALSGEGPKAELNLFSRRQRNWNCMSFFSSIRSRMVAFAHVGC